MNFCVTDGESVIAIRYIASRHLEAASLVHISRQPPCRTGLIRQQWFSSGTTFSEYSPGGHYKMTKADKRENIIMVGPTCVLNSTCLTFVQIASEPLTFEKGALRVPLSPHFATSLWYSPSADWMEIRTNHMVVITPKMNLLQIPIVDKFYVPPSDPAALTRSTDFAQAKGLLHPRKSLSGDICSVDS